ncbi:hypothetical protein SDRG_14750 [Saprolegnia diclina VS20]|uniref:RNA polymerase II-associated protein 1 C-terminal domain-containing protein n=1 Tax=Saprolegnia diclina (strain VS20) TaxID=1156394 RepID=T0PPP8_SAPDV|nr:hypothetical protein SDRG_14750 [Saprolegnia diclina VS20]EQC27424.1 hypothetical protein SDRG_14750 [Saprolegnia diclina VS20]|eukprot:XP_008619124.1 hypothetical protein SDRG_14750 [Saprolegnia diclina VS20]
MAEMDVDAELALLLKEQEQFMQGGKVSSVKLHTKPKPAPSASNAPPTLASAVMRGAVLERSAPVTRPMPTIVGTAQGFPSTKKQSVFGRRRAEAAKTQAPPLRSSSAIPSDIQADNDSAIANMSLDEIKSAQDELHASLSPEVLAMFRNRAKAKAPAPAVAPPAVAPPVAATPRTQRPLPRVSNDAELASAVQGLPDEERAKHEWMTSLPPTTSSSSTAVRVDFDGHVLPATDGLLPPSHSGLYHHGDDPDRPGYTIEELVLLARSTVASQRVVACTVLGKVLRQPEDSAIAVGPIALALRHALDDANQSVLTAGIDALHAALVRFDVLCIQPTGVAMTPVDRFGKLRVVRYLQPAAKQDTDEDDDGDKDPDDVPMELKELAAADAIQALLKTHLPFRLRHLLSLSSLRGTRSHDQVLDLCVALAMHSRRAATHLLEVKGMTSVLLELLSHEGIDDVLATLAMRRKTMVLLRRLCQANAALAAVCLQDQLLTATKVVLAIRHPGLLPLQLDALRLWSVCLSYGIDLHSVAYLYPLLCGYPAAGLAADGVALSPWPIEVQCAILDALTLLVRNGVEAAQYYRLLPFFVQQATDLLSQHAALSTSPMVAAAVRFLAAAWPIVQFNTTILDVDPYIRVTPVLSTLFDAVLASSTGLEWLPDLLAYFTALAAAPAKQLPPVSLAGLAKAMTPGFLKQLAPHRSIGVACALFCTTHGSSETAVLWPLCVAWLASCQPGDEADARSIVRVLFATQFPALCALFSAMAGASPNPKETCHVVQPEDAPSTLPWPTYWLFSLFSRIASSDMSASAWQTLLAEACSLLLQLETSAPALLDATPTAHKLVHLSHVYLLETDAWLSPAVATHLQPLVAHYVNAVAADGWHDALGHVVQCYKPCEPGKEPALVQSFVESLLQVFCGASYGDVGVSAIMTLCLHPSLPLELRLWLWSELSMNGGLALVTVPTALASSLLATTESKMLDAYVASVVSVTITATRGKDLYAVATHHLARYCLGASELAASQRQQQVWLRLLQSPAKALAADLAGHAEAKDARAKVQWCLLQPSFASVQPTLHSLL